MNNRPKTLTISPGNYKGAADYATGRKVYTPAEIDAIDDDFGMDGQPVFVRCTDGTVADLNNDDSVEILYGANWKITGFRRS